MHLVGFITRIYHDARSPERQIKKGPAHSKILFNITVNRSVFAYMKCYFMQYCTEKKQANEVTRTTEHVGRS